MFFPYRTEPIRPALIMIAVVLVAALLAPSANLRILILVLLSGPIAWSALQWTRRGRGVRVDPTGLVLQSGLWRRSLKVPNERIQAHKLASGERLALAYLKPRDSEPGEEPRPPRLKLYVTAALAEPAAVIAALPLASHVTPDQMDTLLFWRRIRRFLIVLVGLFLGIPALMILLLRVTHAVSVLLRGG